MKIAHCADIHIRLLKRHSEYSKVFDNFQRSLFENEIDRIVVAGDLFHNKVSLSPEAVRLGRDFLQKIAQAAPVDIIVGNHDCIVNQPNRLDAITPVLDHIDELTHSINLWENSGIFNIEDNINYGIFAINDEDNFPYIIDDKKDDQIYIALFHGAINKAKTDVEYALKSRYNVNMFDNYDFAFLGDIHKMQVLSYDRAMNPKIAYSGSLIQQNHGEVIDKGYLIWDTEELSTKFVKVENDYGFYTIKLNDIDANNLTNLAFEGVPKKPYIRVLVGGSSYNQVTLNNIASTVREMYNPLSLSVEVDMTSDNENIDIEDLEIENVTQLSVQQKLLRNWFDNSSLTKTEIDNILSIHSEIFNTSIEVETKNRGINWNVHRMNFSNTFSYGEDNSIDFDSLDGLVGIFAPNRAGKSALLATLLNGLFNMSDRVSRSNISDLINSNESNASIEIYFSVDNRKFVIMRIIERRPDNPNKGKTKIALWEIIAGQRIPLSGDARVNETEQMLKNMLGSYLDHRLTTFGMQNDLSSFLDQNQASRKESLSKFLGLDVIDQLYWAIKAENDGLKKLIKQYKEHDFNAILDGYIKERDSIEIELADANKLKNKISKQISKINEKINEKTKQIENVDYSNDVDIKGKIRSLEMLIKNEKQHIIDSENEKKQIQKSIDDIENELNDFDELLRSKIKSKLVENKEKHLFIMNSIMLLKKDLKNAKSLSEILEKHDWFEKNDYCKKCSFLSEAFIAKNSLDNFLLQIEEKNKEAIEVNEKIEKAQIIESEFEILETKLHDQKRLASTLDLLELRLKNDKQNAEYTIKELDDAKQLLKLYEKNEATIEKNERLENEIAKQRKDLNTFSDQSNGIDNFINKRNVELGGIKQKIDDLGNSMQHLTEIEETFRLSSMLQNALSKDGIQLQIIKKVIPRINMELRKILSNVTDFDIILEIDDESRDIGIYIDDGNSKRSLDLGSGMEKSTGSIAIRAAIANISLIPRCNLFIIDEGFGTLDSDNLNNMNMLLGYLKSIFKTVIIISHISEMQDIVDHIITMERDENGYSKIKFGN